jgi:hypothetical protein
VQHQLVSNSLLLQQSEKVPVLEFVRRVLQ